MSPPLTHRQRMRRNRVIKARRALQELRTLKREGVLYARNTIEPITLEQWRAELRGGLHYRINKADPGAADPIAREIKDHERAQDIARRGTASKWFKVFTSQDELRSNPVGVRLSRIIARGVTPPGFTAEEIAKWRFWHIAAPMARSHVERARGLLDREVSALYTKAARGAGDPRTIKADV